MCGRNDFATELVNQCSRLPGRRTVGVLFYSLFYVSLNESILKLFLRIIGMEMEIITLNHWTNVSF